MDSIAKDVMTKQVISIDASKTITEAAKIMTDAKIGSIVVTENNVAIGILTERDFIRLIAKKIPLSSPVKKVMSSPLIIVNQNNSIWEIAELMKNKQIHRVPVINEDKMVGIITTTELTKLCSLGSDSEMRKVIDSILMRIKPKN